MRSQRTAEESIIEPACVYRSWERERVELCQYREFYKLHSGPAFSFENSGQPAFALNHLCYFTFRDALGLNAPFNLHAIPSMGTLADLTMPTVLFS